MTGVDGGLPAGMGRSGSPATAQPPASHPCDAPGTECKHCGGSSTCEHHWQRGTGCAKKCGGISICEHHWRRDQCRECPSKLADADRGAHAGLAANLTGTKSTKCALRSTSSWLPWRCAAPQQLQDVPLWPGMCAAAPELHTTGNFECPQASAT